MNADHDAELLAACLIRQFMLYRNRSYRIAVDPPPLVKAMPLKPGSLRGCIPVWELPHASIWAISYTGNLPVNDV